MRGTLARALVIVGLLESPGRYFKFPVSGGVKNDRYIEGWRIEEDGFASAWGREGLEDNVQRGNQVLGRGRMFQDISDLRVEMLGKQLEMKRERGWR